MDIAQLETKTLEELRQLAKQAEVPRYSRLKKQDLILGLLRAEAERKGHKLRGGILEVVDDGMGFLRAEKYLPGPNDIYVSQTQIKKFNLRTGDMVIGQVRPPKDSEKYFGLLRVDAVNGLNPEESKNRPLFEELTPIFPLERFNLETRPHILSTRVLNLIAPIGKGQRGLIVSPPKAGKTTILKDVANAISTNYPDVHLMIALIGERPEEVTDMDRSVDAEVIASTFDDPVQHHVRVAEMALERAKRLVEIGRDVVILLDSITRLARAYNLVVPTSGRTLSGGLDPSAIQPPKRIFGAARNVEEGGSLTIIATCLVNTGSKMDDVIYEEFKGTGNMELHLNRKLQERRIFPAFDLEQSSTRREELLLGPDVLQRVYTLRRMWAHLAEEEETGSIGATERLLQYFRQYETNEDFLNSLPGGGNGNGRY
ncbi:MAG: transcription termination factor Rho [Phototrophicales bacterium]|nr:MAG: transcription termination factor Rho [Phototrophicales bacterium]RMG74102.1 MAG: transcription termination factor Rho [Chloroflexota bacterium]